MTKHAMVMIAGGAILLWVSTALAMPTAQQRCDSARIRVWKTYLSCVNTALAKDAKGVAFDEIAAFARCRHAYFKQWTAFQKPSRRPPLTGSTCIGTRFTDNGDQTVTDNLSGLAWEKKDNLDASPISGDPHDGDNTYSWSTGSGREDGTVFSTFLASLNSGGCFAGSCGWRLPTFAELQTIVEDFACTGAAGGATCRCGSVPCIDGTFGATQTLGYWSATTFVPAPSVAWDVYFLAGVVYRFDAKTFDVYVRAVRGGL